MVFDSTDDWILGEDGFYYYQKILNAGETTTDLNIHINGVSTDVDEEDFNVVVVYECTRVLYDEEGNLLEADWHKTIEPDETWEE